MDTPGVARETVEVGVSQPCDKTFSYSFTKCRQTQLNMTILTKIVLTLVIILVCCVAIDTAGEGEDEVGKYTAITGLLSLVGLVLCGIYKIWTL
jgi:hypothetical protein